jgi:hypothetical protein
MKWEILSSWVLFSEVHNCRVQRHTSLTVKAMTDLSESSIPPSRCVLSTWADGDGVLLNSKNDYSHWTSSFTDPFFIQPRMRLVRKKKVGGVVQGRIFWTLPKVLETRQNERGGT